MLLKCWIYSKYQDMLLAERESEILSLKKEVMQNEVKMLSKDMVRNGENI